MIHASNLTHRYGEGKSLGDSVFEPISFDIHSGEYISIMGPSGSGKSTLFQLIAGLIPVQNGSLRIDGKKLENLSEDERSYFRSQTIGFVFQSFHLFPHLTAGENITFPLEAFGLEPRYSCEEIAKLLGIEGKLQKKKDELSGGEQQRVAIARAFIGKVPIILADEPTGNLDYKNTLQVLDMLDELHKNTGTTILLITHDPLVAARAQRQWKFENGILQIDTH